VIGGFVATGIAVVAGSAFAIVSTVYANNADTKLDDLQPGYARPCMTEPCKAIHSDRKTSDTFANLSVWTFVASGALGAGTAIYAFAAPTAEPKRAIHVVPVTFVGGGGLIVGGTW
jgi:hypothetical protein